MWIFCEKCRQWYHSIYEVLGEKLKTQIEEIQYFCNSCQQAVLKNVICKNYLSNLEPKKQLSEIFYKIGIPTKYRKIHWKISVWEPLCKPMACNCLKEQTSAQVFYSESCKILKNTFFYRTPPDDCFWILLNSLVKRHGHG